MIFPLGRVCVIPDEGGCFQWSDEPMVDPGGGGLIMPSDPAHPGHMQWLEEQQRIRAARDRALKVRLANEYAALPVTAREQARDWVVRAGEQLRANFTGAHFWFVIPEWKAIYERAGYDPKARWFLLEVLRQFHPGGKGAWGGLIPVLNAVIVDESAPLSERQEAQQMAQDIVRRIQESSKDFADKFKLAAGIFTAVVGAAGVAGAAGAKAASTAVKVAEQVQQGRAAVNKAHLETLLQTVHDTEDPDMPTKQFAAWLKQWKPELFDAIAADMSQSTAGLGALIDTETGFADPLALAGLGGIWDDFLDTASNIATKVGGIVGTLLPTYYEKKILDIQLERAQAGQPPLSMAEVQALAAQQAQAAGQPVPSAGTIAGIPLTWILLGGLGFFAWQMMGDGRRRRR